MANFYRVHFHESVAQTQQGGSTRHSAYHNLGTMQIIVSAADGSEATVKGVISGNGLDGHPGTESTVVDSVSNLDLGSRYSGTVYS